MTSRVHVATPVQNGEVQCFRHPGIVLPRRVSRTEKNPNRAFYSCEVSDGTDSDGATCTFFKWEDELSMTPPSQDTIAPQYNPQTPRKRTTEYELSPAQSQPNTLPPTPSPRRTAGSQARLDAILRAQGESETSTDTVTSTSSAHNNALSPSSSSRPATTSQTQRTPPLLPSWCSPKKPSSTSSQSATPSSAAKRQTTREREEERSMAASLGAIAPQYNPQTPSKRPAPTNEPELAPPQKRSNTSSPTPSPQRTAASQARLDAILRAQCQTPSESEASTGINNALPGPSSLRSAAMFQTSPILPSRCSTQASPTSFQPTTPPPSAERHRPPQTPPFIRAPVAQSEEVGRSVGHSNSPRNGIQNIHGASVNAPLDDPFTCPTASVTGSGGSEPRGPVTSHSDGEEVSTADEYLDYSNRVAEYIRLLERRLQTAEKSDETKARRIERLQEEIDRLKVRNEELESTITNLI
ncbi:hypothetical protein B0H12DRAFT_64261 [Mycena haematopus]|nr:hypothetical protein B0H12DRAFT_64261 [Mycena haematopus]